jgi:hypothetical protein
MIKEALPLLVSCFETPNESEMREYIKFPSKRWDICNGEVFFLTGGIEQVWRLMKDKYFVAIHFFTDEELLLKSPQINGEQDIQDARRLIEHSDAILGLSFKKLSNASLVSLLKCYKMEDLLMMDSSSSDESAKEQSAESLEDKIIKRIVQDANIDETLLKDLKKINTMSIRCELYVPEDKWRSSNQYMKTLLSTFIDTCEEKLGSLLLDWNLQRTELF